MYGTYGQCRLCVEQALSDSEALNTKHLVPAVWHLEWSRRQVLDCINVRVVAHTVRLVKLARTLPDLNHALLERGEDALFLVLSERVCRRNVEVHVFSIGWLAGIDGRLGLDHVMGHQRSHRVHFRKLQAQLL